MRLSLSGIGLLTAAFAFAPPGIVAAQQYPETAAVIAGDLLRCGDTALAEDLGRRYAGNRDFTDELHFRRKLHESERAGALPEETCIDTRELAREFLPSDRRSAGAAGSAVSRPRSEFHPYAIVAGATVPQIDFCGFTRLSYRIRQRFSGNDQFDETYLKFQQKVLDYPARLKCEKIELGARRLIVSMQIYDRWRDHSAPANTPMDRSRIHCLLPGLQVTMPMSTSDCGKRRGKVYSEFTRVDHDYAPDEDG